jgi:GntR family transcriptional regulator
MQIEVDLTTHTPIYLQVMRQVKHAIATGELKPDDQLPTVRQLAADLRVNFNTVARAYRLLDEEGIISTQHGRGTFILDLPSGEESERLRRQDLGLLAEHFLGEAQKLGFSPDEVRALIEEKFSDLKKQE